LSILKIETPRAFKPLLLPSRYKGAYGGRGSGKSHFFAEKLVEDCLEEKGMLAVCIREVQKSLMQSSKRLLEAKIAALGVGHLFKVFEREIETPGDGVIIFQGLADHHPEPVRAEAERRGPLPPLLVGRGGGDRASDQRLWRVDLSDFDARALGRKQVDSKFVLFGGGWQDYRDTHVQPVLDDLDRQINDIRINGVEGQLAQLQAQDDASAVGGGTSSALAMLPAGVNQRDGSWYSPFGAGSLGGNTANPGSYASKLADTTDKSKLFEGIADAFGDAGLMADTASAGATYLGKTLGSGDTAALRGLEGATRHIISARLSAAEGVANTFKDVADGYSPAESILGNILRSGTVYGGGMLAGSLTAPLGAAPGAQQRGSDGFNVDKEIPARTPTTYQAGKLIECVSAGSVLNANARLPSLIC